MLIFWIILGWVIFWGLIGSQVRKKEVLIDGHINEKPNLFFAILVIFIIVFFAGFRSGVADTGSYIAWFNVMPSNLNDIPLIFSKENKDLGFILFSSLFKSLISDNYQVWLFSIAIISCIGIFITLYRYSTNFFFSMFLFVTSCQFIWLFNGIRQFMVAAILFGCFKLILSRKFFVFLILVLMLSTIHISALIMIPIYFFVSGEPWDRKIIFFILTIIASVVALDKVLSVFYNVIADTQYSVMTQQFANDDGVNKIRVIFESVPVLIAFWYRKKIKKIAPKYIKVSINMSIIAVGIFVVGSVTSGIYVGRMPIYFSLYNLILIPWLISNVFTSKFKPLAYYLFIVVYIIFFFYQMVVVWDGVGYISEVLNIYRRWMTNYLY